MLWNSPWSVIGVKMYGVMVFGDLGFSRIFFAGVTLVFRSQRTVFFIENIDIFLAENLRNCFFCIGFCP